MRHSDPKFRAGATLTGIFLFSLALPGFPQVCEVSELEKLTPFAGAAAGCFGCSVSISGNWLIIGAYLTDVAGSNVGAAYLFRRDDAGTPTYPDDDSWVDVTRVSPTDANPDHWFGKSVAINSSWAVVGAPRDDDPELSSGSAYVFRRDDNDTPADASDDLWIDHTKLTALDATAYDWFGYSVAIGADWIVVGARTKNSDDGAYSVGAAYVFHRDDHGTPTDTSDDAWVQQDKLIASDGAGSDYFGSSVSISDPWIVVGAPDDDDPESSSGSAYVFRRDDSATPTNGADDSWIQVVKLIVSDAHPDDEFGASVSIDGERLVVGAYRSDVGAEDTGSAYVYRRYERGTPKDPSDDTWLFEDMLTPAHARGNDWFGVAVSISGDRIAVGAHGSDDSAERTGSIHVFQRDDNGTPLDQRDDAWVEIDKLVASDAARWDRLGGSVSISGERVVGGASGAAYIFGFHADEPFCGDDCCNGAEDCTSCPEDCVGCGDRCCTGSENPCSCPEDCANVVCGDGCLSGDEECTNCPIDCPQLFTLEVPELRGGYSCAWGNCFHDTTFDFGRHFLSVNEAWLHVSGESDEDLCEPESHVLYSSLDGVSSLVGVSAFSYWDPFEVDVPLSLTPNVLDGQGVVGLIVVTESQSCYDSGSSILDATLWFSAVPSPLAASLAGVAGFQRCFSGYSNGVSPGCEVFDFDDDEDVDLTDYVRFRMGLSNP